MAGKLVRTSSFWNPTILQRLILSVVNNSKVRKKINESILELVTPYVPKKGGNLRRSAVASEKSIRWTAPYARYQYGGVVYAPNYPIVRKGVIVGWYSPSDEEGEGGTKHPTTRELGLPGEWKGWTFGYTTSGTKHHWVEEMLRHDKRRMQIRITNILKRELKRRG